MIGRFRDAGDRARRACATPIPGSPTLMYPQRPVPFSARFLGRGWGDAGGPALRNLQGPRLLGEHGHLVGHHLEEAARHVEAVDPAAAPQPQLAPASPS